jgi:two-component system sensor histidine kinase KdpD
MQGVFGWTGRSGGWYTCGVKVPRFLVRVAVCVAVVAVVTGAVFALKAVAPVLSLGVLYLFAVLPVAVSYGLGYAIVVSVASMLAFNFFFLPPLHTLALTDSENWVALAVYLVTAVVVSELAAQARRRAIAAADAEALRRSDAVKTAVLHAVSHDLRSPLTAIRAAGEGLESGSLDLDEDDRAALLETIAIETARLERLVSNLLDLSRLEAGAARPEPELWPIDELISRALEALGADASRISVVNEDAVPPVLVDAAQLERTLVNVLENALRLSSPADPVDVAVQRLGPEIHIRVSDRGPGLEGEDLERIFEPFEHGGGHRRGTGLGLAIARGFAEANGCRLWAEARPGSGATFVLALPAAVAPAEVPT